MITFLIALAAVFMVCVVGMVLAAILDPGEALPTCPECGEPHDQEQCTQTGADCDCCRAIDQEAGR